MSNVINVEQCHEMLKMWYYQSTSDFIITSNYNRLNAQAPHFGLLATRLVAMLLPLTKYLTKKASKVLIGHVPESKSLFIDL